MTRLMNLRPPMRPLIRRSWVMAAARTPRTLWAASALWAVLVGGSVSPGTAPCRGSEPNGKATIVAADLLIVGGTESGCAAAVQAARMGVEKIVLVNDITWLGGQFSAEGLGAIDENRAHGYNGRVPIPRSGLFREVIDNIEQRNAELYGGVRRPGNTRVITTCRPQVAEKVFRDLLAPWEATGQLLRYSNYQVASVGVEAQRVRGVRFAATDQQPPLDVRAKLTIDASDWGDVIQRSGAPWDAGIDARSEFNEPTAPLNAAPTTDLNPITWCMILEQQSKPVRIPSPPNYDPRYFNQLWGWIDEEFAYTSRRLVDAAGHAEIDVPDLLLVNSPPIDYPLDSYPRQVAAALEQTEAGASRKNFVALSHQQRAIVYDDARRHTLKYLYHLQQRFPKFRRLALSEEFGTEDKLPPKPYIRESLRLVARHVIREQEVLGFGGRSNYATTMFPDAVFSWQFEMDFHPTKRHWTTDKGDDGPWEAVFRGNRRFGRGGTGRCVFPLRALIPRTITGLLGAQKNLGYTSIVGSSCRLHDHSIHAGQASGAVAAVSLRHREDPAGFYLNRQRLEEIWSGLLDPASTPDGDQQPVGLAIWPLADVDPMDKGFVAIQQLALRRALPLGPTDTSFYPDREATAEWTAELVAAGTRAGYAMREVSDRPPVPAATRRELAVRVWNYIKAQTPTAPPRNSPADADGDGLPDAEDPLPFTPGTVSWQLAPEMDGLPDAKFVNARDVRAFNFTGHDAPAVDKFRSDSGQAFDSERGWGWLRASDGSTDNKANNNTRVRQIEPGSLRDGFVFTRTEDVWECAVPKGTWLVQLCIGDIGHDQPGQNVTVEGQVIASNVDTSAGGFREFATKVTVRDGRLTVKLGTPRGGSNTCINWLMLRPPSPAK